MASAIITPERLREVVSYDPETGEFRWKSRCSKNTKIGSIAGGISKALGYWIIGLDNRLYYAHRLAWLHVHGEWPTKNIDHFNGVRHDNRIVNLRDVSQQTNIENRRAVRKDSATGLMGVYRDKGTVKLQARITANKVRYDLGWFDTAEEAHAAYLEAKRRLHAGCTI